MSGLGRLQYDRGILRGVPAAHGPIRLLDPVNPIQRVTKALGTVETSGTVGITAVDLDRSIIVSEGSSTNENSGTVANQIAGGRARLTADDTVTVERFAAGGFTCSMRAAVIQFRPNVVKRIQRVTGACGSNIAITTVDTARTLVFLAGVLMHSNGAMAHTFFQFEFVTAASIKVSAASGGAGTFSVSLVELWG